MPSAPITELEIRQAAPSDAAAIEHAHRDAIESMGPAFYPWHDVEGWKEGLADHLYVEAMKRGEVFFIATGNVDGAALVLGFASEYPIKGTTHGTSVYVRGIAARRGVGTALLRRAEEHALARGANVIRIEASLAGVEFYTANGYQEVGRGETRLTSGYAITTVAMRKVLAPEFRYAAIEEQLVEALPEIRPAADYYWKTEGRQGEDSGAYIFFEDLFAKYIEVLLWLPPGAERDDLLGRAFAVVERMLGSSDRHVRELASIGLLEGRDSAWLQRAQRFIGARAAAWLSQYDPKWRDRHAAGDDLVPEILDGYHVRTVIANHLRGAGINIGEVPGSTYAKESLPD